MLNSWNQTQVVPAGLWLEPIGFSRVCVCVVCVREREKRKPREFTTLFLTSWSLWLVFLSPPFRVSLSLLYIECPEFLAVLSRRSKVKVCLLHFSESRSLLDFYFCFIFVHLWLRWVFIEDLGLLIGEPSLAAEHGLQSTLIWAAAAQELSSCGTCCPVACRIFLDKGSKLCPLH